MKATALFVVALLVAAGPLGAAEAPAPAAPLALPAPFLRDDPDGGRTLLATLDDGEGGTWREFPVSDEGLAAFTDALASRGVALDPVVYGAELRELGLFLHAWQLDGSPYVTLGTYHETASLGKIRLPALIVENVTDLEAMAELAGSLVAEDAIPIAAEMVPHTYGLVAPDLLYGGILAGVSALLVSVVFVTALQAAYDADDSTGTIDLPPEWRAPWDDVSIAMAALALSLAGGQFGLGGGVPGEHAGNFSRSWTDRPEVRVWTARKAIAGQDVWMGASLSRTGETEGDGFHEFHAWKRISVGPSVRIDGRTDTPAAVYLRAEGHRHYVDDGPSNGPSEIRNRMVTTVGVATLGTDTPLAEVHMEEERLDDGDEGDEWLHDGGGAGGIGDGEATYLPDEQCAQWSAGPVVAGEYTPLVGARTQTWHDVHMDVTNLGDPILEWESERLSSAGVFVEGEYVPLVGARTWSERFPIEYYALLLVEDGVGSQRVGDLEASVGTFHDGDYQPLAAARYDDDFPYHIHPYRAMVSAGTYDLEGYAPLVGATYDGEGSATNWTLGPEWSGHWRWQTSAGFFTLGHYRPVIGARFVPATHDGAGVEQESYQVGIYPLNYDPFIPVASLDYSGDVESLEWAFLFVGTAGYAPPMRVDAVGYTPGPHVFPILGLRYERVAPDLDGEREMHVVVGTYDDDHVFHPFAGASYAGSTPPLYYAAGLVLERLGGPHEEGRVSAGLYVEGHYVPIATLGSDDLP